MLDELDKALVFLGRLPVFPTLPVPFPFLLAALPALVALPGLEFPLVLGALVADLEALALVEVVLEIFEELTLISEPDPKSLSRSELRPRVSFLSLLIKPVFLLPPTNSL